jgi:hypothetical protein
MIGESQTVTASRGRCQPKNSAKRGLQVIDKIGIVQF